MYIFLSYFFFFFFFNDTATTEIYTLSLHDALPISRPAGATRVPTARERPARSATSVSDRTGLVSAGPRADRKSTRLNSSHGYISYAVFCLKKKKKHKWIHRTRSNRQTETLADSLDS